MQALESHANALTDGKVLHLALLGQATTFCGLPVGGLTHPTDSGLKVCDDCQKGAPIGARLEWVQ